MSFNLRSVALLGVVFGLGCGGGSSAADGGSSDVPAAVEAGHDVAASDGHDGPATTDGSGDASCTPTGTDVPDDQFKDTNCDGIDGDVAAAVFVAPGGDDTNDGSMAHPLATLGKALQVAAAASKAIYVAGASGHVYTETTTLVLAAGVSIYGGYDAANGWRRDDAHVPDIRVQTTLAVRAASITASTTLDRLKIAAGEGAALSGASSIGLLALDSPGLVISHCEIQAGAGMSGTPGTTAAAVGNGDPGGDGGGASCNSAGIPSGGPGGFGGTCSVFPHVTAPRGQDGESGNGFPASSGQAGANGAPGSSGAAGAAGSVNGTGTFVPGDATSGTSGQHGGAGGGGLAAGFSCPSCSGTLAYGPGGGGGGGAGCGGGGGGGGKGGGASIAVVVLNSALRVSGSTLTTAHGGPGGEGGAGATKGLGGGGGGPGAVLVPGTACSAPATSHPSGYKGGDGGDGGNGGGGAGGPSVGIWVVGTAAPTLAGNTFHVTTGGSGGLGGGSSSAALKGADGMSRDTYFQP